MIPGSPLKRLFSRLKLAPFSVISMAIVMLFWLTYESWVNWIIGAFPDRIQTIIAIDSGLITISWIIGALFICRMTDRFIWRGIIPRINRRPVPRLLTGIFDTLVGLIASIGILVNAFSVSLLMVAVIFGGGMLFITLFLKRPLDDLFAGLSLQLDTTISIGDVIRLQDGETGVIEDTSWRSARIRTLDGHVIMAPNSQIAGSMIKRISNEYQVVPDEVRITLDFNIAIERGIRVLKAAVKSASGEGGVIDHASANVMVAETASNGIVYILRFYYSLADADGLTARTVVMRQVMRHLFNSGLAIAQPKQNVFLGRARLRQLDWMEESDRPALIITNPLFSNLLESEAALLAGDLIMHHYSAGETIIEQGGQGNSMFGVTEGLLKVMVSRPDKEEQLLVARLDPGSFFGEMSLLAGEPRSATVTAIVDSMVYEIRRDSILQLLQSRPEIGAILSEVIARRNVETSSMIETATNAEREAAIEGTARSLFAKMKSIFGTALRNLDPDRDQIAS